MFTTHKKCLVCCELGHKKDMVKVHFRGWYSGRWYLDWAHKGCIKKDKKNNYKIREYEIEYVRTTKGG